jgi:hypothetical protein
VLRRPQNPREFTPYGVFFAAHFQIYAQATAVLEGTIVDPNIGVIPGASVTATSIAMG